jgi:hypothetical protein
MTFYFSKRLFLIFFHLHFPHFHSQIRKLYKELKVWEKGLLSLDVHQIYIGIYNFIYTLNISFQSSSFLSNLHALSCQNVSGIFLSYNLDA